MDIIHQLLDKFKSRTLNSPTPALIVIAITRDQDSHVAVYNYVDSQNINIGELALLISSLEDLKQQILSIYSQYVDLEMEVDY